MPQLQTLAIVDRETTPVTHTFTPLDIKAGVGTVVRNTGIPEGNETITISMRKSGTSRYRGKMVMTIPVVQTETINGVSNPVVVRRAVAELNVTFDSKSTTQERANLLGLLQSSISVGKVLTQSTFIDLEGVY